MNMDSLTRLVRAIFQNATEPLGFISVNVKFLTPLYEYIEESIGHSLARPDGPPVTLLEHLPPVYVDINREGQVLFSLERDKLRCPHILTFHFGRTEARARVYQGEDMCRAELRFSDTDQADVTELEVGDTVLLPKYGGIDVEFRGERMTLMPTEEIIGKFVNN
ncbi:MAG: hypothetical protein EB162_04965 [Euryarchaeota archaeon]|nr:hypothetical protein [Euryarchaeota archaeon]